MTQSNPPVPPPPDAPASTADLQFDTAEPAAGPAAPPTCVACNQPIMDVYYAAGDKVVCPSCREQYVASMAEGSGFNRFLKATVFGIVAGAVGTAIWLGVRVATGGWTIGLIAIVVGLMVGAAVRAGSERRGGRGYQFLAVLITYLSVCATYVPQIISDGRQEGIGGPMLVMLACVLSLAAPFLGMGIIGILILGFALWEAWKINTPNQATLTGPYALANQPGGPPLPPPPGVGSSISGAT